MKCQLEVGARTVEDALAAERGGRDTRLPLYREAPEHPR